MTPVPLTLVSLNSRLTPRGEGAAKSWGQESTQGHSVNWGQSSSEKAPLSLALVV